MAQANGTKKRAPGGDELVFTSRKARRGKQVSFVLDDETFVCRPKLPAPVLYEHTKLLRAAQAMKEGAEANEAAADALLGFLKLALGPDEYERFWAFVTEPERETDWETLGEIHRGLLKRYSGHPTVPSSG